MSPIAHAVISWEIGRSPKAVAIGLLPDVPNLLLVTRLVRLPESDARVRASRVAHSPIVVIALLALTRGRAWPYALHWACDVITHAPHQWAWPFVRRAP